MKETKLLEKDLRMFNVVNSWRTTRSIINRRSRKVWSCDKVGNEYIIYQNNQTKVISETSLINNWCIYDYKYNF